MRDLVRAREDAVGSGHQAKSPPEGVSAAARPPLPRPRRVDTPYRRWLADLSFPSAAQHIALQEYRDRIEETERRLERLTEQLRQLAPVWRWAPVVAALQALRGVSFITAVGLVAELGDLRRFSHPRELMAYLGLVPSEHSSGPTVRRGAITKAGNPHVRRLLAEAAWAYQGIPRIGRQHAYRQEALPKVVCDIAWRAQLRLTGRFRRLVARGQGQAEGGDGDRARARRIHLGDRARGAARMRNGASRTGRLRCIGRGGGTVARWRTLEDVKGGGFGRDVRA